MPKILVVEDDVDLAGVTCDCLTALGHEVEHVDNGSDAQEKLLGSVYDLIMLDWDLPEITGIELLTIFRNSGGTTPVLMLTGRHELDFKEAGLEAGADDYLTKPFELRELKARIKSLLRRTTTYNPAAAAAAEPATFLPGSVLGGKYVLKEVIGEGGMAVVWKATHAAIDKTVVVKVLKPHLVHKEESLKRLELESRALAKISHPNVVAVTDVGTLSSGQPYMVLEYIQGKALSQYIYDMGPLPLRLALRIAGQMCMGLSAAHKVGVIHRDLKPGNVIVQDQQGRPDWVKIVDFGIAQLADAPGRLTQEDVIVGTIEYISPEQLEDCDLDQRADLYAAGIIMYEMLTGKLPFEAKTPHALLAKKLMVAPERLPHSRSDVPDGSPIDCIVRRALERDRDLRYINADEMVREIEWALDRL